MAGKNTPGVMLRGQHCSRTFGAGPVMGFSGKKAKSEFRRAKSEFRPRCGAGSAGWRLLCRAGGALCRAGGAAGRLLCRAGGAAGRLSELRELRSDCSDSCRLRRAKVRTQNIAPLSLEGVSQMHSILPERLLALVRPAFDLVLRRIRSLKRCVQTCGCKIMTPRYAV